MTRPRSNNRDLTHWIVMLSFGTAVYLIGRHFAHAAVAPADPPPTATLTILGLPWQSWVVIALGALAAVRLMVDAALAFFKTEAPLTKTLVDDHIRDSLQGLHDKLGKLAGTVNVLVDASKPPGAVPVLSVAKTGGAS